MGKPRIHVAILTICATALVFGSAVGAVASPAMGGYSVRPGEIDQNDPATRAYFKPVLKPGATATHHVVVTNLGSLPLHLLVDSVDGLTGVTSGAVYANRQDPVAKAGQWVVPSTHSVTIRARGTASVAFAIHVPNSATPGDHLAGIAFQNTATNSSSGSFAVKQIVREVVGIEVRVPGPASEHLSIGALALQSLPGTSFASVIVNLSNVGQLLCKPALTVALHGPNGSARTVTRTLDTILPGDTIPYPMPWPDALPAGKYTARASTTACGPTAATADVPLVLGAPLNGSEPSTGQPARTVHTPSLSMILTIGLALLGILFGLLIGKRRRREEEEEPRPVLAPPIAARVRIEAPAPLASSGLRRIRSLEQPAAPAKIEGSTPLDRKVQFEEQPLPKPPAAPEQQSLWP